jgi:hypothetical protein
MTSMEAHMLDRAIHFLRALLEEDDAGDDTIRDVRALLEDIEEFEPELRKMK